MSAHPAVIITGGARRIGAALARHFAAHDYDIVLHYHRSETEARQLQHELEKQGATCRLYAHDLADIQGLAPLIKRIHAEMPHCTALINNASVFERAEFLDTDEALFDRQFDINFKAPFFLTQAFAQRFGKGCVINILDTDIVQTGGSHFAYLLSKKALADFTRMAARALGPGIRVNGVCPTIVLPSGDLDKHYMKRLEEHLPLKCLPSLAHITEAARWLCENAVITGQLLYIDGGKHVL